MKTPKDKYRNDPEYRQLVDMLESMIERAHYTPSELREAAILASINYEMRQVRSINIDPQLATALEILDGSFLSRRQK